MTIRNVVRAMQIEVTAYEAAVLFGGSSKLGTTPSGGGPAGPSNMSSLAEREEIETNIVARFLLVMGQKYYGLSEIEPNQNDEFLGVLSHNAKRIGHDMNRGAIIGADDPTYRARFRCETWRMGTNARRYCSC